MECRHNLVMRILFVSPPVKRVNCEKTEENSIQIFVPYERKFSLVFWEQEWLVGRNPFYVKFLVNRPLLEQNQQFWTVITRSASAVTPSEKNLINTYRKSPTRFPMSLRWSSYVAPKPHKGALKCKMAIFRPKSHFALQKSATNFLCVKTVSDKVVKPCKMIGGGNPFCPKFWVKLTVLEGNLRFSIYFRP